MSPFLRRKGVLGVLGVGLFALFALSSAPISPVGEDRFCGRPLRGLKNSAIFGFCEPCEAIQLTKLLRQHDHQ